MTNLVEIEKLAGNNGLVIRGGFTVTAEDAVPDDVSGRAAKTLLLFGNVGSSLWQAFSSSPEYQDGEPDPLDRWSERVGTEMAKQLGCRAYFPFGGPPYQPFLQWAKKAESLINSRLGMLIHPEYGLWHAYRFALAMDTHLPEFDMPPRMVDVCASCIDTPCLNKCPAEAFTGDQYKVEDCYGYLSKNSESNCRTHTCIARSACPEGYSFRYDPEHANFHMQKFYENLTRRFEDA